MDNPISRDAINRKWPIYQSQVRDRLCVGAEQYGDGSFTSDLDRTFNNIAEELLDVSGWAFILWCKLKTLQETIRNVT